MGSNKNIFRKWGGGGVLVENWSGKEESKTKEGGKGDMKS